MTGAAAAKSTFILRSTRSTRMVLRSSLVGRAEPRFVSLLCARGARVHGKRASFEGKHRDGDAPFLGSVCTGRVYGDCSRGSAALSGRSLVVRCHRLRAGTEGNGQEGQRSRHAPLSSWERFCLCEWREDHPGVLGNRGAPRTGWAASPPLLAELISSLLLGPTRCQPVPALVIFALSHWRFSHALAAAGMV